MILKGPIKFLNNTIECTENPCSEIALDMDVHSMYAEALTFWSPENVRKLTDLSDHLISEDYVKNIIFKTDDF